MANPKTFSKQTITASSDEDALQVKNSVGTVVGWIDSAGVPQGTMAPTPAQTLQVQTNGVDNGSQSKLNLVAGTNTTLTDNGTGSVTIASGATPVMTAPGYFFPSFYPLDPFDYANVDPRGGGLSLCTNYKQFYLPYDITITKYAFQIDGAAADSVFYAGIYTNAGALIFDIGNISLAAGAGLYGKGQAHDPGTNMFDASRAATNSVHLTPGWYYYGWGASGGAITFPSMGPANNTQLWTEVIGGQPTGTAMPSKQAHSASFDITGGHLPLLITSQGGPASVPPNIAFLA